MEVLTAYVRENAPVPKEMPPTIQWGELPYRDDLPQPRVDIQAILTVLCRRDPTIDPPSQRPDLSNSGIRAASLTVSGGAHLKGTNFRHSDLSWADLSEADLEGARFLEANLNGTDFREANLRGAILTGANLVRADMYGTDLSQAHLVQADLSYARLKEAILRGAYLPSAKLVWAHLSPADLRGANLGVADLSHADLYGADLTGALLIGANLNNTILEHANLSEARSVSQEQLNSAAGDADTKLPPGLCLPRNWKGVTATTPRACPAPK